MRKSLLLIAAIVVAMTASAQKTFKYFNDFKPVKFATLNVDKAKKFTAQKFNAPSLKEDADGNPSVYYARPAGSFFIGTPTNKYTYITSIFAPSNTDVVFDAILDPKDGDLDFEWKYALSETYNAETKETEVEWSDPIEGTFVASEPDEKGYYDYDNRGEYENGSITLNHDAELFCTAPVLTVYGGDPRNPLEASYAVGDEDGVTYGLGSDDIVDYGILSQIYADYPDLVEVWNNDMHFVNYDPSLRVSFYSLDNYFAANSDEANTNLNSLFEFDAIDIQGFAEYFTAASNPYYLTGVRGTISAGDDYELEADDVVVEIISAATGEVIAEAPVATITKDSWDCYFIDAPVEPVLIEDDFLVQVTPAEGSEAPIAPMIPTTKSEEAAYSDGTIYLLANITSGGKNYDGEFLDVYGLRLGDYNYVQASMIGITTTYTEPDGIATVSASKKADNAIYSISGVKVSNGSTKGLATGVYVQNGKKVFVK